MSKQNKFWWEGTHIYIPTVDPHVTETEKPRLNRQAAAILERLRLGDVSNTELAGIAIRYSARIHDLRGAGYLIEIVERNRESGLVRYRLTGEPR